jgi:signal transduction histidine kinase
MKQKLNGLSQRYLTALRKHLQPGAPGSFQPAFRLGRQAVALGLETLDLARIHEEALVILELSEDGNGQTKRAEIFFNEALTPIVETHRAARQSKVRLSQLQETLGRRTEELAASQRQRQRGAVRQKVREKVFAKGGKAHSKCLEESLQLQSRLRQLTHRAIATQEKERYQISHELQDDIAQTLLGINVRLLTVKQLARSNSEGLKNAIASVQRLVVISARSVRRFARKLDAPHPRPGARSMPVV